MSRTLEKIREKQQALEKRRAIQRAAPVHQGNRRHEAAEPLLEAFSEIAHHFLKIDVMKQLWPHDYHKRDDRVLALLHDYIGDRSQPHGIQLKSIHGFTAFLTDQTAAGTINYITVRGTGSSNEQVERFDNEESWLDTFYEEMAIVLDLTEPPVRQHNQVLNNQGWRILKNR